MKDLEKTSLCVEMTSSYVEETSFQGKMTSFQVLSYAGEKFWGQSPKTLGFVAIFGFARFRRRFSRVNGIFYVFFTIPSRCSYKGGV